MDTNIRKYIGCAAMLFGAAVAAEGCTTWVVHPSAAKSGRMTVNKCRDLHKSPVNLSIHKSPRGWRWISLADVSSYGMNEKGVVVTCNDGDAMTLHHPRGERAQLSSYRLLRQVLDECDNAYDGAMMIRTHGRNCRRPSYWEHGATLLVADPRRAFIVDVGPGYGEMREITSGMFIYSNKMHLPGNEFVTNGKLGGFVSDRAREANTRKVMNQYREDGKFTLKGIIRTSRAKCGTEHKDKHPFRSNTQGDTCFEIDAEFPAYLTTAYTSVGPQRHTVFLPLPMALREMPETLRNGKWSERALKFREKVGDEHPNVEKLYEFEAGIFAEYAAVREKARELLRAGKEEEAVKLLNECFERQFKAADEFLDKLFETTPGCADPSQNCGV